MPCLRLLAILMLCCSALPARAETWVAIDNANPPFMYQQDNQPMGLYPLNGTVDYVLLTPRFDEVRIQREGLDLTLTATGAGHLLDGVSLDGEAVEGLVVSHEELTEGSELVFSRR